MYSADWLVQSVENGGDGGPLGDLRKRRSQNGSFFLEMVDNKEHLSRDSQVRLRILENTTAEE